mmetsp:Transcript_18751/g.53941  ORF Transcript_18751/g.53941 Transcript_18751/m.53941 type:complete len:230 (+) Transcript_18751:1031-1720(+)
MHERPSLIGKSTTSNRSSCTTALLNLCIRPASLRALRFFFNALSSRPSSSLSISAWDIPSPLEPNTRPFQRTLSTTIRPPFLRSLSLVTQASTYSKRRVLSASTNTMSKGAVRTSPSPRDISSTVARASFTFISSHPTEFPYDTVTESSVTCSTWPFLPLILQAASAASSLIPYSDMMRRCEAARSIALESRSNVITNGPPPRPPGKAESVTPNTSAAFAAPSMKAHVA